MCLVVYNYWIVILIFFLFVLISEVIVLRLFISFLLLFIGKNFVELLSMIVLVCLVNFYKIIF